MDALISSAVEEICYRGEAGVALPSLWGKLTPPPSPSLKASLWSNLLLIPTLQFSAGGKEKPLSPEDPKIQRVEDAEKLKLKIVAKEHLRDCFVGLYDVPSTGVNPRERRALERIAIAREDGITQSQLAKEFNMEGKNFFYIVKNLESRNLIVRQPAIVKTKEAGGAGETKSAVSTNLMYLSRYATHLGVQQRFEINKEERDLGDAEEADVNEDGYAGDGLKDDVLVKDNLPAMRAICDKLDGANGNVLVISDVKRNLGYCGRTGHRAWRHIFQKLKEAGLVEEFDAKVNDKVERCIHLLKKFSPKIFETKPLAGSRGCDENGQMKFGRRPKINEQVLELPINQQIYDMVDGKGTEGVTGIEVCSRLGLDKKKTYERFRDLVDRFGMHIEAESHKKTAIYRYWTSANYNKRASIAGIGKSETPSRLAASAFEAVCLDVPNQSTEISSMNNHLISGGDRVHQRNLSEGGIDTETSKCFEDDANVDSGQVPDTDHVSKGAASSRGLDMVCVDIESNGVSSETSQITLLKQPSSHQTPLTSDSALREQRVLERLQDEKIVLRVVLHKWLVSLEKDKRKGSIMDRRTVDRILNKLQEEGHCRCVTFYVPSVSNCGRSRMAHVILHSSIESVLPEQVYDKFREFEKLSRQGSARCRANDSVPVLSGVTRSQIPADSDDQASRSGAMRTNGFVLAKMVRAKLLHTFFWDFLSASDGWDDILSSGFKLFSLQAAVKAIPLELFLQVAGSTQKIDNLVEKCKLGLRLNDLPAEEYRSLMDTLATGRLSLVIDVLRRLKLIRLIPVEHSEDGSMLPHAMFTDAMEFKPYIEEPPPIVARSLDLRPRYRHDFVLSNREAVEDYWKTLEFCYAAADPNAAFHAFPGSAVPEVFSQRSWTSTRVMSAEQRAELLKRIVNDSTKQKIRYKECETIAMDLNLTLQQVLHFYYDKHHRVLETKGKSNCEDAGPSDNKKKSRKRKKSLQKNSRKKGRPADEELVEPELGELSDGVGHDMEGQSPLPATEHDHNLAAYQAHTPAGNVINTADGESSKLSEYALSKIMPRREQQRFSWSDDADRQLIIQYARHRSILGARFHRVDWNQIPGLPGPPKTCARRMATLKRNKSLRKALMKLCNILSERYVKHLEKNQGAFANGHLTRVLHRHSTVGGFDGGQPAGVSNMDAAGSNEEQWDDFSEQNIKEAFDDVILYKQLTPKASKGAEEWSNLKGDSEGCNVREFGPFSPGTPSGNLQNLGHGKRSESRKRLKHHKLQERFMKCLNESSGVDIQLSKSVAISNAVELLKLVFLSSSTLPDLQNMLGETLRHYSEHDLFAAFSYLRANKILIGGNGGPFVLSQQFLHNISKSPFPSNTGKMAARFSNWLREAKDHLIGGGIALKDDLQCGDILHLFALVSSGEMAVSPCVPDGDLGEADAPRSSKRKTDDDDEPCDGEKSKKLISMRDSELFSRREKGFPGLRVSIRCATILPDNVLEPLDDRENGTDSSQKDIMDIDSITPSARLSSKSSWEAMTGYASYLHGNAYSPTEGSFFSAEVFRASYKAIHNAGDQGLSIEEVSKTLAMPGEDMGECVVDVLQTFGRVLKINAFDSVRVVDALYRSKYCLTLKATLDGDPKPPAAPESSGRSDDSDRVVQPETNDEVDPKLQATTEPASIKGDNDVHRVTILNLPDGAVPLIEPQSSASPKSDPQDPDDIVDFPEHRIDGKTSVPLLPWINGDGSTNKVVFRGLIRRALGTVMQNPGILEEDVIKRMDVLNPQSCRRLLELMILDGHLNVRKMHQSTANAPPALLGSLLRNNLSKPKSVYRNHFFANPKSASLL
ncbi:unnamed protein product [Linum tenue]|uniref:B-block binding subunit of TFIIIC domain-containing protein n=1 Tax=Linum tenue TaxID=586396 RepID=A0AAV0MN85_9ROSI|nr:unnamed protein product [Linum tenue]